MKAGAENIFAEQAHFPCLADGNLEAMHRDRIFCAHINIALVRTDGVAGNRHCLKHRVRVALQNGAIHKRAGVALVRVTDDIFLFGNGIFRKGPFQTRGEAAAAAAAQPAVKDCLNDIVRRHGGEHLSERRIAVHGDIFVDILRVDHAAVSQRNALLRFIEGCIVQGDIDLLADMLIHILIFQPFHRATLEQMLRHDFGNILCAHAGIEGSVGIHNHNRTDGAQPETARADNFNLFGKLCRLQLFFKSLLDLIAAG